MKVDLRTSIAFVISQHRDNEYEGPDCGCGWDWDGHGPIRYADAHDRHVADAVIREMSDDPSTTRTTMREPLPKTCNPHPDAPHGFDRNSSHDEDRYVCDCESWTPTDSLRDRIAWLMWCANEGYLTDADRAGVSNIFTADPSTLHPDDAFSLPHWRGMADAVIRELETGYVLFPKSHTIVTEWTTDD